MKTNGAGTDGFRELEMKAIDNLPPKIAQAICDAPINLGAWGIYQHVLRMRLSGSEIDAYLVDLDTKIRNMMRSEAEYSTSAFWKGHPQNETDYPWPEYQKKPRHNRNRRKRYGVTLKLGVDNAGGGT